MKQGEHSDRCVVRKEEVFTAFGSVVGDSPESSCFTKVWWLCSRDETCSSHMGVDSEVNMHSGM